MPLLSDRTWKTSYNSDDLDLVSAFYVPALECAVRYDRATGYFDARALALASRGLEGLVRNEGRMRLVVGCTLGEAEVEAIERGESLKRLVESVVARFPLQSSTQDESEALELLSWMVARGFLEVKIAIPCDHSRRPVPAEGIFHAKAGILEDKTGDRLAFDGSVNETARGWGSQPAGGNWERLTVHTDLGQRNPYVEDLETEFRKLWNNELKRAITLEIPEILEHQLLKFLPEHDGPPKRLQEPAGQVPVEPAEPASSETEMALAPAPPPVDLAEQRRLAWGVVRWAPSFSNGGERVGEATSAVTPWPHQVRAFHRMYDHWPPRLLIADEVGLGKTIEAGMLLRQAWLSGKARRVLILAPKAVLVQWQIELREKFNLNWPIYDGQRLRFYSCPALGEAVERKVGRDDWHREPCTIVSSHLMRRSDRAKELLENAEPWDLVVLDEAHHARRRSTTSAGEDRPNQLLRLMRRLRDRTPGLVLLTATPMQVDPIEVWDLLQLLGLPEEWTADRFLRFFNELGKGNPSDAAFDELARMFQSVERHFGEVPAEEIHRAVPGLGSLATRKILAALRDPSATPRRQLSTERRKSALAALRAASPVGRLVSRHTRELLRRYYQAGKITTPIAQRHVDDLFADLSTEEARVYQEVEDYISSTYDQASAQVRTAVGFVMTIYRRRLASSFAALERTLSKRLEALRDPGHDRPLDLEDISDDETREEAMDEEEAGELECAALKAEEGQEIERLLELVRRLPVDTKTSVLVQALRDLKANGYDQSLVFTQYTDTLDFLREELVREGFRVLCFTGRGGETRNADGTWRLLSREDTKRMFREGGAEILLCTDAAAEGLNFQYCGAVINYDMPWNPMRVEQRIGRIDRLGQRFADIRIVNLHYRGTVETDVYMALRQRVQLFTMFVGKLQPILARLPRSLSQATLARRGERERIRESLLSDLGDEVREAEESSFDLDQIAAADLEEPVRPAPLYGLDELDRLLARPDLLPPGLDIKPLGHREYALRLPGMDKHQRVTTRADFFEEHPGSTELWAPGSPLFPQVEDVASEDAVRDLGGRLDQVVGGGAS